ncbi:hypothetical protein ACLOJK_007181 [Asimina triloba]
METRSGGDAAYDPIDVSRMVPSAAELALKIRGSEPSITTSASVDQGDGLLVSDEVSFDIEPFAEKLPGIHDGDAAPWRCSLCCPPNAARFLPWTLLTAWPAMEDALLLGIVTGWCCYNRSIWWTMADGRLLRKLDRESVAGERDSNRLRRTALDLDLAVDGSRSDLGVIVALNVAIGRCLGLDDLGMAGLLGSDLHALKPINNGGFHGGSFGEDGAPELVY